MIVKPLIFPVKPGLESKMTAGINTRRLPIPKAAAMIGTCPATDGKK